MQRMGMVIGIAADKTVIAEVPWIPSTVAVMVALPCATPLTRPV